MVSDPDCQAVDKAKVLILVVMEYGLRLNLECNRVNVVLILVVMEYGLRHLKTS